MDGQLWLAACSARIHDMNECWLVLNWTSREVIPDNLNPYKNIVSLKNTWINFKLNWIASEKLWIHALHK